MTETKMRAPESNGSDAAQQILEIIDNSKRSPSDLHELWYIVDKELLNRLNAKGSNSPSSPLSPDEPNELALNNKKFLQDQTLRSNEITSLTLLNPDIAGGLGDFFEVVDEESWRKVEKLCKVDVSIPRRVRSCPSSKLVVEVQPIRLAVYHWERSSDVWKFGMEICVSAEDQLHEVFQRVRTNKSTPFEVARFLIATVSEGGSKLGNWLRLDHISETSKRTVTDCQIDMAIALCCSEVDREELEMYNFSTSLSSPSVLARLGGTPPLPLWTYSPSSSGGSVGLANLGNTCFMNSALQCLSKILPLSDFFLSQTYLKDLNADNVIGTGGELANCYAKFLKTMFFKYNAGESFAPRDLRRVIARHHEQFEGYLQQDSQELLAFLLDGLHEDLNRVKNRPVTEAVEGNDKSSNTDVARESWKRHKLRNDSIVVDMFQGLYRSRLECPQCSKVSIVFDPFMYLTLPLPEPTSHTMTLVICLGAAGLNPIRTSLRISGFQPYCVFSVLKEHTRKHIIRVLTKENVRNAKMQTAVTESLKEAYLESLNELTVDNILIAQRSVRRESDIFYVKLVTSEDRYHSRAEPVLLFCWILPTWNVQLLENRFIEQQLQQTAESLPDFQAKNLVQPATSNCSTPSFRQTMSQRPLSIMAKLKCRASASAKSSDSEEPPRVSQSPANLTTPLGELVTVLLTFGAPCRMYSTILTVPNTVPCSHLHEAAAVAGQAFQQRLPPLERGTSGGANDSTAQTTSGAKEGNNNSCVEAPASEGASEPDAVADEVEAKEQLPTAKEVVLRMQMIDSKRTHARDIPNSEEPLCDLTQPECKFLSIPVLNLDTSGMQMEMPEIKEDEEQRTLDRCIRLFLQKEFLDDADSWYCPRCKQHVRASKKIDLWSLPSVLILHLKRFHNANRLYRSKIDTLIGFPHTRSDTLDMTKYMLPEGFRYMQSLQPSFTGKYDLVGVNCHSGCLGGGHYTANVLTAGQWKEYNDDFIQYLPDSRLEVPEAYLLFYQLRGPKTSDSYSKTNFG